MSVELQEISSILPDQADRDAARKRLDKNLVVTAGAGTGKTELLIDRALFTILGKGAPVQSLVALTFTEKAAGEIRVRLADRLSRFLAAQGGEAFLAELESGFKVSAGKAAERAKAALEDMDQAPIGTLHSFAARILRSYPLEAGVDPGFQVDEGDFWEEFFESEWAAWLDVELGEHAPREKSWLEILRLCPLDDLEALARSLCQARVDLNKLSDHPSGMRAWMLETAGILEAEPKRQPKARGKIEEQLKEIAARLRRLAGNSGLRRGDDAIELPHRLPSLTLINASWPAGWDQREQERWEAAKRLCSNCSPETEALFARAVELLRPYADNFRKRYAWRGFISFDGLLLAARNLVRDNRKVREELKAKYRVFLVDEFQDTDPLQGEILMYLAEKPGQSATRWQDVCLDRGKLFVVGDPKQSIYRFRGADIAAYEHFIGHILAQGELTPDLPSLACELQSNFRSQAGIVECVNAVFEKLMKPVPGSQPPYHPIHAVYSHAPSPRRGEGVLGEVLVNTVTVRPANPDDDPPISRVRRAEAEWIAGWIEDNQRRHRFKDIALLFRSTTPLAEYLEIFKARGIPYVVEGEKYFYGTQEVQDFLNLLRVLDDPGDKIALVGLLRSPIVGMTDEELRRLAVARGLNYLSKAKDARLEAIFESLREIRAMVGRRPLGEILRAVFDKTRLLELASAAYHDQQTLANLLKLGRMAADSAEGRGETLKGFIHRVARFVSEAREEGESPLADESLDAVRVLTIHKSKGLEYPVVILPNLAGKIAGNRNDKLFRVEEGSGAAGLRLPKTGASAAMLYLEEAGLRREKDEQVRLLYVAFTRAKERLILLGSGKPESQSLAGLLLKHGLWPSLGPGTRTTDLIVDTSPPSHAPTRRAANTAKPMDLQAVAASWLSRVVERDRLESQPRFVSPSNLRRHALRDNAGATNGDLRNSPSGHLLSVTPAQAGVHHEETSLYMDSRLRGNDDAGKLCVGVHDEVGTTGDLVGKLCHKALERWDFSSSLVRELMRAREYLTGEAGRDALNAAAKESEKMLAKFEKSPLAKDLKQAEILGREMPFVFGLEGRTIRGTVDLLCRRQGKLCVVDYKTDRIQPADLREKAKIYEPQMTLYAQAVSRALGVSEVGWSLVFLRLARAMDGTWKR